MASKQLLIDSPSVQSLMLQVEAGGLPLSHGTGFIVLAADGTPLLITNWHVLAGRHPQTRQPRHSSGAIPESVTIGHNQKGSIGSWVTRQEPLLDGEGQPRWIEHPVHGASVDVVALPLQDLTDVELYPYSVNGPVGFDVARLPAPVKWGVSDYVNIIGFPFGWTAGGLLGIWVQGAIASEPELDFQLLPRFLIDSRTRPGQSGSPVVMYKRASWVTLENGRPYLLHNVFTYLLGVYSGRLSEQSDLGTVWKTEVVADLIRHFDSSRPSTG